MKGDNPLRLPYKGQYQEFGAKATDNEDGDITYNVIKVGINTHNEGASYPIRYKARDSDGNNTTIIRTVTINSNQPPAITLNRPAVTTFSVNDDIATRDPGATALDPEDGQVNVIADYSRVNNAVAGQYTVTYTATDHDGLSSTHNRTVTITDSQNATITLEGESVITLEVGQDFIDPGFTAANQAGQNVNHHVTVNSNVDTKKVGVYNIQYQLDSAGTENQKAITAQRTVVVKSLSCPSECRGECIQLAAHHMQCASDYPNARKLPNGAKIVASRTECTAPCGIHFQAQTNQNFSVRDDFHHVAHHWYFDDDNATYRSLTHDFPFGRGASRAQGPYAAHVFEQPGTYTIALHTAAKNGRYANTSITIHVLPQENTYTANDTYCVSSRNQFQGCPAGAIRLQDWSDVRDAIESLTKARVLLHAGEEFWIDEQIVLRKGDFIFDRYGRGHDPILRVESDTNIAYAINLNSITVTHMNIQGNYDPTTGLGESFSSSGFYFGQGRNNPTNNVTFYRNSISGIGMCFSPRGGNNHVYADNHCRNWQDYGSLATHTHNLAFIGNRIRQHPKAISGPDGKLFSITSHNGNGRARTFTYDFELKSPEDIAAQIVDDHGTVLELERNEDFSLHPSRPQLTLNQPPSRGEVLNIYHRRWADHGAIRVAEAKNLVLSHNDLFNNVGWFGDGVHHNPAFRYNTDGFANHSGVIVENTISGGTMAAVFEPANPRIATLPGKAVVERNIFTGAAPTYNGIRASYGGMTLRNNVISQPNIAPTTNGYDVGILFWENYSAGNRSSQQNFRLPVEVYNNTFVNLSPDTRSANGRNWADFMHVQNQDNHRGNAPTFTNFTEANSLTYSPQANLSIYHTNPRFNDRYHAANEADHPAEQDLPGLFDTLWGFKRSTQTTSGATEKQADQL
ncbi:hypothetical protein GCM10007877_29050 [Marinibactrum halimedae]|uniref:DUF5011 domain-containing protein n=1 Tax=Marinibactrum halimedae TaxID=1444977 RepID=A0AA37WPP6_9GAMM|nr:hypothetical protein GCM10007877_29050 [Marinibactrum halimedae]